MQARQLEVRTPLPDGSPPIRARQLELQTPPPCGSPLVQARQLEVRTPLPLLSLRRFQAERGGSTPQAGSLARVMAVPDEKWMRRRLRLPRRLEVGRQRPSKAARSLRRPRDFLPAQGDEGAGRRQPVNRMGLADETTSGKSISLRMTRSFPRASPPWHKHRRAPTQARGSSRPRAPRQCSTPSARLCAQSPEGPPRRARHAGMKVSPSICQTLPVMGSP